jgi:hypothetical protein
MFRIMFRMQNTMFRMFSHVFSMFSTSVFPRIVAHFLKRSPLSYSRSTGPFRHDFFGC